MPSLNDKQRRFAAEYLVDLNATQAAIRAGYSAKTAGSQGFDLLKKPEIAALVAEGRAKLSERTQIDQEYVIRGLVRNHERAAQAEVVHEFNCPRGETCRCEYRYDGNVVNGALKLLGLHLGMFVQKHDHTSNGEKIPFLTFDAIVHGKNG
jgi:phage terminase small subunit